MILGWFTDIPSRRGRGGIRIRESGLEARICHSDLASRLGGGAGLDGDGATGDSTGTTIMRGLTAGGTTPAAGRFITGARMLVADLRGAVVSTVPVVVSTAAGPGLLTETGRRLEDMVRRADRAECARGRSAVTTTADKPGASHRVEAPASVAEGFTAVAVEDSTEAEAVDDDRTRIGFE
jgi:hypothetical protein